MDNNIIEAIMNNKKGSYFLRRLFWIIVKNIYDLDFDRRVCKSTKRIYPKDKWMRLINHEDISVEHLYEFTMPLYYDDFFDLSKHYIQRFVRFLKNGGYIESIKLSNRFTEINIRHIKFLEDCAEYIPEINNRIKNIENKGIAEFEI